MSSAGTSREARCLIRVVILHSPRRKRIDQLLSNRSDWHWIYFGKRFDTYSEVQEVLRDRAVMINAGEMLNHIAKEARPEVLNFDQHLDLGKDELLWQTTALAEKTPHLTDLFFNCCAYVALDRILRRGSGSLLVFVEDWMLGSVMAQHATELGFDADYQTHHALLGLMPSGVRYHLYRSWQWIRAIAQRLWFIAKFVRTKMLVKPWPVSSSTLSGEGEHCDVLLVTWVDTSSFQAGRGKEADTYFGCLPGFLRKKGYSIRYLALPVSWIAPLRKITGSLHATPERVLFVEQCLRFADAWRIAWSTLRAAPRIISRFAVQGVDCTALLEEELAREMTKGRQCWAAQYYYVGRFLREHAVRASIVVHPYENQAWEKVLRLGLKDSLPEVSVMGYVHSAFPPNWLSFYPSELELGKRQLPDIIVTPGPAWARLLTTHGYPADRVVVGPALRFEYLFDQARLGRVESGDRQRGAACILVATGIGYQEACEHLRKTIEALWDVPGIRVLIKFHPKLAGNRRALIQSVLASMGMEHLPQHCSIAEAQIAALWPEVDLVLHNGSVVGIEAMAIGVDQLIVESELGLDMDYLPFAEGLHPVARTARQIRESVLSMMAAESRHTREYADSLSHIVREAFWPVSEESMEAFLLLLTRGMPSRLLHSDYSGVSALVIPREVVQ